MIRDKHSDFKFILRRSGEKTLLCVDGAFRTLGSFRLENTIALPSPPELPLWAPQRTRKRSCCGTPDWMPAQGVVSPRTLPESSPGFLSLRVLVRNKWGNHIRRVLTPSIPRCPGTRDITLRWMCPSLCSGWALVFSLAQLLFPLALITACQFSPGEPLCHCPWFGCPPLANGWERDPHQTN